MAQKTTLTVASPFGTFTRTTARTYTHLVVVRGYRAERLEAHRLALLRSAQTNLAKYERTVETGQCQDARPGAVGDWDRNYTSERLADGSYVQWIVAERAELARLTAIGPITEDRDGWHLSDESLASTPVWFVLGWCGRLDLARKLAATDQASSYREVAIVSVATGEVAR